MVVGGQTLNVNLFLNYKSTLSVALHLLILDVEVEGLRHTVSVIIAPDLHF